MQCGQCDGGIILVGGRRKITTIATCLRVSWAGMAVGGGKWGRVLLGAKAGLVGYMYSAHTHTYKNKCKQQKNKQETNKKHQQQNREERREREEEREEERTRNTAVDSNQVPRAKYVNSVNIGSRYSLLRPRIFKLHQSMFWFLTVHKAKGRPRRQDAQEGRPPGDGHVASYTYMHGYTNTYTLKVYVHTYVLPPTLQTVI